MEANIEEDKYIAPIDWAIEIMQESKKVSGLSKDHIEAIDQCIKINQHFKRQEKIWIKHGFMLGELNEIEKHLRINKYESAEDFYNKTFTTTTGTL